MTPAETIEENVRQRYLVRQAARRRGAGKVGEPTGTSPSAARRILAGPSPRTSHPAAVRAAVSGPAPSYFGFALSLVLLVGASGVLAVGLAGWVIHDWVTRLAGSD